MKMTEFDKPVTVHEEKLKRRIRPQEDMVEFQPFVG